MVGILTSVLLSFQRVVARTESLCDSSADSFHLARHRYDTIVSMYIFNDCGKNRIDRDLSAFSVSLPCSSHNSVCREVLTNHSRRWNQYLLLWTSSGGF